MENRFFGKRDLILILSIAAAALLMLGIYSYQMSHMAKPTLEISVSAELYGSYDLTKDAIIAINNSNICRIENGVVTMISADCPDQICVHSLPIDAHGGSIICLPNQVVLNITNATEMDEEAGIDAIT